LKTHWKELLRDVCTIDSQTTTGAAGVTRVTESLGQNLVSLGFDLYWFDALPEEGSRGRHLMAIRNPEASTRIMLIGHSDTILPLAEAPYREDETTGRVYGSGVFDMKGSETLHLASYAPPVEYLGKAPYQLDQEYSFGDAFRLRIPDGFSWQKLWDVLVESCLACATIAAEHGRTIIMEPRVGEIVCSVDSLIRLIQDVGMPNFKANFDTGHFSAQRENVVLALAKLEGKFANIHVSDNDPKTTDHLPPGEGTIDWPEFFRVLKAQGYRGYLGLDLGGRPTIVDDLRQSVEALRAAAEVHGISLEC